MSRKQTTTFHFNVKIKAPVGADRKYMEAYLRDAIASHCGGMAPSELIFDLSSEDFTVSLIKKETVYAQR